MRASRATVTETRTALPVEGYVAGTAAADGAGSGTAAFPQMAEGHGFAAVTETLAEGEVIPVLRETVHVSKREVETGRVTVHKTVTERDEAVEMLLRQTDVSIERVPVNQVVTEAPASRNEGDVLVIPVMEEVLVVEKRLVLKEELHIRKTSSERQAHETVRLRSEQVHIEGSGTVTVPPSATLQES